MVCSLLASFYFVELLSCDIAHGEVLLSLSPSATVRLSRKGTHPADVSTFLFQITVETARRRLIRIYFGINKASLLWPEVTPIRVDPSLVSMSSLVGLVPFLRVSPLPYYLPGTRYE